MPSMRFMRFTRPHVAKMWLRLLATVAALGAILLLVQHVAPESRP